MPTITGELTNLAGNDIAGLQPRMWWRLNRPALHGNRFVTALKHEATITGNRWAAKLEPTYHGEFYSVQVEYFDPHGERPSIYEVWPQRIQIGDKDGDLGGLPGAVLAPDSTWVGLETPPDGYFWWLEATVGDPDTGELTGPGNLYRFTKGV